ncbi:MAG: alanine racemase, partial [Deltaproteobacteria bacterium]|nr:alanine racemase [Deltaproteobacteria bacterium]
FSTSDEADKSFARMQISRFDSLIREIEHAGIKIPMKHMANSGGVLDFPEANYDLVRPGIMIYGLYPSPEAGRTVPLRPAMVLKTRIALLRNMPAGSPVSYGRTYHTTRPATIAVLPMGYADGYSRQLSNRGYVTIRGQKASITGRVRMDMFMVDVSDIPEVQVGDEAVLFGTDPSIAKMAEMTGTIVNDVVCAVGKRVPRIYLPS